MKGFSPNRSVYVAFLLIATEVACDTGSGVERGVTGSVQDRTMPTSGHADAAAADVRRHHDDMLAELRVELGLSGEQFAQLQEIFARRHAASEAAWAQA